MERTFYKTADGNLFYTRNTAELHAKTLEDRKIEEVIEEVIEGKVVELQASKGLEPGDEDVELSTLSNNDLKAIATDMGLTLKSRTTKAELIELIQSAGAETEDDEDSANDEGSAEGNQDDEGAGAASDEEE